MADHDEYVRLFHRLSDRRLRWAKFHLAKFQDGGEVPEALTNLAVENAAMAVECVLKGLIVSSTPIGQRDDAIASFRGSRPHDSEWLEYQLSNRGVGVPRSIQQSLVRMRWWEYRYRYSLKVITIRTASEFLLEADRVATWVKGRI